MKVRIRGNALRFRITPEEVACLRQGDRLEDAVYQQIDGVQRPVLEYAVALGDCAGIDASTGQVTMKLSESDLAALQNGEQKAVQVRHEAANSSGESVRSMAYVEIEKERRFPRKGRPDPSDWVFGIDSGD